MTPTIDNIIIDQTISLAPNKILIKIFPNLEGKKPIIIPKEFIGDFLRGFFDADGNVHLRPLGKTKIKGKFRRPRAKLVQMIRWLREFLDRC